MTAGLTDLVWRLVGLTSLAGSVLMVTAAGCGAALTWVLLGAFFTGEHAVLYLFLGCMLPGSVTDALLAVLAEGWAGTLPNMALIFGCLSLSTHLWSAPMENLLMYLARVSLLTEGAPSTALQSEANLISCHPSGFPKPSSLYLQNRGELEKKEKGENEKARRSRERQGKKKIPSRPLPTHT